MQIREASSLKDLDEIALIQREVWKVEDIEITGRLQLKASQYAGASILVAQAGDGTIAGFAYAVPAFNRGEVYWHSDMLAVRSKYRSGRVGQSLKWSQREHALRSGIRKITWTFDPMQAGNAHLNIEILGVTVREYLSNFYGVTSSVLHHGMPTDRLLASWELESPRVVALSRGETPPPIEPLVRVTIPPWWNDIVNRDQYRALQEQRRVETELTAAFARGLVIYGFDKPSTTYLLSRAGS